MNKKYKIILLLLLILCLYLIYHYKKYKNNETYILRSKNKEDYNIEIELVISRYNEDLEWLKEEPFNKYRSTCYNKGTNQNFYKPQNMKIFNIPNVGRCDHTYIYHIVNNYNTLPQYIMFLPGSCDMKHKKHKAIHWLKEIERTKAPIFIGERYYKTGIGNELYDFQIDEWESSDFKNKNLNPEKLVQIHTIRPFGKWYENHFGDKKFYYVSYFGVIGVSRKHILTTPKEKYITFMEELNKHSNPEVGHYFERAWAAIFNITDEKNLKID
jgi:hypothetical protein